jgi:SSS family solute:Na+ symporter
MATREVYRQGASGVWLPMIVLFLTPFYWLSAMWLRRVRATTTSDFYDLRYKSRFLSMGYAAFSLLIFFLGTGFSYVISAKTMMALTPRWWISTEK